MTKSTYLLIVCVFFVILGCIASGAVAASLQQAQAFYGAGQIDAAIEVLLSSDLSELRGSFAYEELLGNGYFKQEKIQEAISAFTSGIAAAKLPDDLARLREIKRMLASCYMSTNNWANAASTYESLASENTDGAAFWLYKAGDCYLKQGKVPETISAFTRGIAAGNLPGDLTQVREMKSVLAGLYMSTNNWANAASTYESLASENPDGAAFWLSKSGYCYLKQEKNPEAISAFKRGIAAAKLPGDLTQVREMTRLLLTCPDAFGDTEKAADFLLGEATAASEALKTETNPENKRNLTTWLADCYRAAEDYDAAIKVWQQLLVDCPQFSADHRFFMAMCFEHKKQYDRAIEQYKTLLANDHPGKETKRLSLLYVAKCLREQGKYQEEIDYLRTVAGQYPENRLEALLWIGEDGGIYLKDYDAALTALKEVLAEMPPDDKISADDRPLMKQIRTEAEALIPSILEKKGDVGDAIKLIREQMPKDASATSEVKSQYLDRIAGIYLRAGKYSQTIDAYGDVLRVDGVPASIEAEARYNLGVCYDKLGSRAVAVDYMREVVNRFADTEWAKKARGQLYLWGKLEITKPTAAAQ